MPDAKIKFLKDSAIYTIGNILPKALYFFMIPIYTSYLDPKEYGIVNTVLSLGSIFSMTYILGLDGAITRFYYEYKDEEKKQAFISTIWLFLLIFTLSLTLVLLYIGKNFNFSFFKSIPFDPFIKLMLFNCFLSTFTVIPLTVMRMKEQAFRFGFFSIITTITNISFIFYFVVFLRQGASGNLKAYVYTNIVFSIIYLFLLGKDLKLKISIPMLKESLSFGIPLIPHGIGGWVLSASDRLFLEHYRTLTEVGLYSLGYQFGLLLDYILGGINNAYVPFFFKTAKEDKNCKNIFEDILKYYSVFILTMGFFIALFSRELIMILARNKSYYDASKIIPLITIVSVLHGYYYMSVNSVFYARKTNILALTTGLAAIINISLNFYFVPKYGMYGATFTTIVAYFVLFVLTYRLGQKYYPIKWNLNEMGLNILLCVVFYFIGSIKFTSGITEIFYKIVVFLVYIILLFVLKLLSFKTLVSYYNSIIRKKSYK